MAPHSSTLAWKIPWTKEPVGFSPGVAGGSVVKNLLATAGDVGLIPESERSPGEGNGNSLQYSCPGNPMGRGAWWTTVHRVTKESDMT